MTDDLRVESLDVLIESKDAKSEVLYPIDLAKVLSVRDLSLIPIEFLVQQPDSIQVECGLMWFVTSLLLGEES